MMLKKIAAMLAVVSAGLAVPALAQDKVEEIKISYQNAFWALPIHIATEKGWWAEIGLKPSFTVFPAGAPQVATLADKAWDVGGTGTVPAVLGAQRFQLLTIGLTNDESDANALMATPKAAEAMKKDPTAIKGQRILLTTNSTVDYAVQSCLRKWGMSKADVQMVNMGQAQIISALTSNNGEFGGLWAPNMYTFDQRGNGQVVCSGKDANAIIPGALVARNDFAKSRPDLVAKFLAVYSRAVKFQQENRAEAVKHLRTFFEKSGTLLDEKYLIREFETRPIYNLAEQIKIMSREGGQPSFTDKALSAISQFAKSVGTIPEAPDVNAFITDEYIRLVDKDPKLKEFANKAN